MYTVDDAWHVGNQRSEIRAFVCGGVLRGTMDSRFLWIPVVCFHTKLPLVKVVESTKSQVLINWPRKVLQQKRR
jgi:hypothetical protein